MNYSQVIPAHFLSRPNRFVAQVEVDGQVETVHVKNTGRCRELLIPGRTVYLTPGNNPKRKTPYDLIAVDKDGLLINMDAQAPNQVFAEWAGAGHFVPDLTLLRPETTWGHSRFDFYWEGGQHRGFVEVKGVTLEEDGICSFPDAPTLRGAKHLKELSQAVSAGYRAYVLFVIQMGDAACLRPHWERDPAFSQALVDAASAGVEILAYDCQVTPSTMEIRNPVPVKLEKIL